VTLADYQPIKGLKREKFSLLSLSGSPNRPAERVTNSLLLKALYAGQLWHCAVMMLTCVSASDTQYRLRLCSSIPMLIRATTSCLELVPGWMLCSGDGDER